MYNDVMLGAGKATGMFYTAPKGTALPTTPGESLAAAWQLVGDVDEDGATLHLPNGDVIRNWALTAKRKINTENGTVSVKIMDTTKKTLEVLFGSNNVSYTAASTTHGNVTKVELSPDVSAEPAAYLFLMKDGDRLSMLGTSDGLITEIADVSFKAGDPVLWDTTIDGVWTFATDDGQVASAS